MTEAHGPNHPTGGVIQAARKCWTPETRDGDAFEQGGGVPHWGTKADAEEWLRAIRAGFDETDWTHGTRPDLVLRHQTAGCWHIACEGCGYHYDEDDAASHFAERGKAADALAEALHGDWKVVGDMLLCPECASDNA